MEKVVFWIFYWLLVVFRQQWTEDTPKAFFCIGLYANNKEISVALTEKCTPDN